MGNQHLTLLTSQNTKKGEKRMAYILQESVGCCLQDPDRHIYQSKNCERRLRQLFLNLLQSREYLTTDITKVRLKIKKEGYYETDHCSYYSDSEEAWVDFKDVYGTRTYLNIIH